MEVDCAKELKESDTMFGELRKILVDHVQSRLKDSI